MSLFNIQELIEYAESTKQEIRGYWYPVRPKQLSGLGGLKQRICHALKVLTGKADVVEWSLRATKKKPVISSVRPTKVDNLYTQGMSNGCTYVVPDKFSIYTCRVVSYRENNDPHIAPAKLMTHGRPLWSRVKGTEMFEGVFQNSHGPTITLYYHSEHKTLLMKGVASVEVEYKVS